MPHVGSPRPRLRCGITEVGSSWSLALAFEKSPAMLGGHLETRVPARRCSGQVAREVPALLREGEKAPRPEAALGSQHPTALARLLGRASCTRGGSGPEASAAHSLRASTSYGFDECLEHVPTCWWATAARP